MHSRHGLTKDLRIRVEEAELNLSRFLDYKKDQFK